jgi:hypothetical protein
MPSFATFALSGIEKKEGMISIFTYLVVEFIISATLIYSSLTLYKL